MDTKAHRLDPVVPSALEILEIEQHDNIKNVNIYNNNNTQSWLKSLDELKSKSLSGHSPIYENIYIYIYIYYIYKYRPIYIYTYILKNNKLKSKIIDNKYNK